MKPRNEGDERPPAMPSTPFRHEVRRDDLSQDRLVEHPAPVQLEPAQLEPGEALLAIERFALTSNTVTYGVVGEQIGYWEFFPAQDGWGRLPVWGIASVADDNATGLRRGDRIYGYFPMASHLVVVPSRVSSRGFVDASAHRQELPPIYNQYALIAPDNGFAPGLDNHQIVYRPLFMTCFVLDVFMADNAQFDAQAVVLVSASSKTAMGTAYLMSQRGVRVIGLTSERNAEFVRGLGVYSEVVTYSDVERCVPDLTSVIIDMAGNRQVERDLRLRLTDNLVHYCRVGVTHWNAGVEQSTKDLPGAPAEIFFAPAHLEQRVSAWGSAAFAERMGAAWQAFAHWVDDKVAFLQCQAPQDVQAQYQALLRGPDPATAVVLRV